MSTINNAGRRQPARAIFLLTVAPLLVAGCAPVAPVSLQQSTFAPAERAPVQEVQPLPEDRNAQDYAAPVTTTEVVEIYRYPVVDSYNPRAL